MASVGQLAAGVAPEINNPLAVIAAYSELLLLQAMPARVRQRLEAIMPEARRAGKIEQNPLSFARPQEPRRQCLSIEPILEQAMAVKVSYLESGEVIVNRQWDDDLPSTRVDDQQILQIMLDIIGNVERGRVIA